MFKKVLIAEDYEIHNLGVVKTLEELGIINYDFVNYCDDAIIRLKKSINDGEPYDLLITDLSFEEDYRIQQIKSGDDLIEEARKLQPNLKVIVFSIEKKANLIDRLIDDLKINGFVSKGRNDSKNLKETMKKVLNGEVVIPSNIRSEVRTNAVEVTNYDITLLKLLSQGWKQQEIADHFKQMGVKPHSNSSIEKRLNDLRDNFSAKNNIEMVVMCKDLGVI